MTILSDLSLELGVPVSALLLLALVAVLAIFAVALYRAFGLVLLAGASMAAPVAYLVLGISIPGCPRFHSVPFGGCSYSDEVISGNLAFWAIVFFAIFCVASRKRPKSPL